MTTRETESSLDSIPTKFPPGYYSIVSEFESQINAPPDAYIKDCYIATLNLLPQERVISAIFATVLTERPMTPQHFVNLYFRSLQDLELNSEKNLDYPQKFSSPRKWEEEIRRLLDIHSGKLLETMLNKSTQTTIYQRYAGPKYVISSLFGDRKIRLSDWGCGGNYGLPGLALNEPFAPVSDSTPAKQISETLSLPLHISQGLAIDQEDPNAPGAREWLHACSFYPSELGNLKDVLKFEKRISRAKNIKFWQQDITLFTPAFLNGHIKPDTFDAVIISTVLYQDPLAQFQATENAKSILKPNGVLIVQDFAKKDESDSRVLNFDVAWHVPGNYRTFVTGDHLDWEFKEVLKWDRARCKVVEPGEDFEIFERR